MAIRNLNHMPTLDKKMMMGDYHTGVRDAAKAILAAMRDARKVAKNG
jgi:hypothetical protein